MKTLGSGYKLLTIGLGVLLSASAFSGCAYKDAPKYTPTEKPKVFRVATRQLPPEPVYNRLRWVRPPQVTPSRKIDAKRSPLILPVVHYSVKQTPACEALLVLAATSRYRSYCASAVEPKRVSLDMLGTIDEIAQEISHNAGIKVVVDHQNQEVRFLSRSFIKPEI